MSGYVDTGHVDGRRVNKALYCHAEVEILMTDPKPPVLPVVPDSSHYLDLRMAE